MNPVQALVFDAYGTLFDVHSVVEAADRAFPGDGAALSSLWRSKQLEYTWLRSLAGRYADFWKVTRYALVFACRSLGLEGRPETLDGLMDEYLRLNPFPEVEAALDGLVGKTLAVLSNGSPYMLSQVIANSGLERYFSFVWSVDAARIYKPAPQVYALAVKDLGVSPANVGFVTANYFDVAGAKSFGFQVYWINRGGALPDELDLVPDTVIRSLAEIKA